jgi:plasmid stabilization system protein ParE
MSFRVRLTPAAERDLLGLQAFLIDEDPAAARRAIRALQKGFRFLELFPFSCRRSEGGPPEIRELLVPFGRSGYVALFEIEDQATVTILAVRHQREDDYL